MTYKELKNKIKEEQKSLAAKITRGKYLRKPCNRVRLTKEDYQNYFWNSGINHYFDNDSINRLSQDFRYIHIMYCQFFNNTPYELIENPINSPIECILDDIKKKWEGQLD